MPKPTVHEALIYLMVVTSASDREMNDVELAHIGDSVRSWPIFMDYDPDKLIGAARECQKLLQEEGGLDKVFGLVLESVPLRLHDTAYAVAVEVAVVDGEMRMEERRVLERLRSWLAIDADAARAIEISAKARYRTLT
nr:tellurite resistance TerB family protein [Mesorhizobium sp.]